MNNITTLLHSILFGDFGLLTLTPRYLFLVLFPIMVFLGIFGQILPKIPFLKKTTPLINQFFYGFIGLGCTTVALASLDYVKNPAMRTRMIWLLILVVPCSSQLAIIATFAAMVTLRVFLLYLLFCLIFMAAIYFLISRVYPLNQGLVKISADTSSFHLFRIVKEAFLSVAETAPPFCVGSILISLAAYFGVLDFISDAFGPFMEDFLHLPKEAASLFVLNILKRDFGSASLLSYAGKGAFDAVQLIVMLMIMTFSVPCFNSTILLVKQQKLPKACLVWLGSLLISILIGKVVSVILSLVFDLGLGLELVVSLP